MESRPEPPAQPRRITLRADRLARIALARRSCSARSSPSLRRATTWPPPIGRPRCTRERERLEREDRELKQRVRELSRGSGLEEEARRQGLISAAERSYAIDGLPQP